MVNSVSLRDARITTPDLEFAMAVIKGTYGDDASIEGKLKPLYKFGRSDQVQTTHSTLMTLPTGVYNETFVSDNDITHFASANSGDTQQLVVEGHTISGTDLTFATQTVTLAGQTKTALTTPLARVTRAYNNGTTDLTGPVYFAEDVTFSAGVPQTASAVHMMIPAGTNQTEKASTSLSSQDYWIVSSFEAYLLEKTATVAEVRLEIRLAGKVFRQQATVSCSDGHLGRLDFHPYLIVPPNSDVRLTAAASANDKDVGGIIQGWLAIVV